MRIKTFWENARIDLLGEHATNAYVERLEFIINTLNISIFLTILIIIFILTIIANYCSLNLQSTSILNDPDSLHIYLIF